MTHTLDTATTVFNELGLHELSKLLADTTDDNRMIAAGIIESFMGIDILETETIVQLPNKVKLTLLELWREHGQTIAYMLLKYTKPALAPDVLATKRKFAFLSILTISLLSFSLTYITAITFIPIPENNIRFADTALGFILGSIVSPIIGYFYVASSTTSDESAQPPSISEN